MRDLALVQKSYELAKQEYQSMGVDVEAAMKTLESIAVSMHCWQGDDVSGFEGSGQLTGGIMSIGNYPGKARNGEELRQDVDKAMGLLPGKQKLNLHMMYAEFNGKPAVDRDKLTPEHFQTWINWAKEREIGLDMNPTYFSHPMFKDNMSLAHPDKAVRKFWIDHTIASRDVAAEMGRQLGIKCVNNIWIGDGMKDTPANRIECRKRLKDSLDASFEKQLDKAHILDAVECKLFGIGSESFVPGSHEFYMGYAVKNGVGLTLDSGHFHPTETISDKISSVLLYVDEILLHVSRGIRWDSDHIVNLTDDTKAIAREAIQSGKDRIHFGLDFFDASVNRVAAWVVGTRAFQKALLIALLEPNSIVEAEEKLDFTTRMVLMEEVKQLNWGAVWDKYCMNAGVPIGFDWIDEVQKYEQEVQMKR